MFVRERAVFTLVQSRSKHGGSLVNRATELEAVFEKLRAKRAINDEERNRS